MALKGKQDENVAHLQQQKNSDQKKQIMSFWSSKPTARWKKEGRKTSKPKKKKTRTRKHKKKTRSNPATVNSEKADVRLPPRNVKRLTVFFSAIAKLQVFQKN